MALPVGLANLGASCFINASVQGLMAIPALREAIAAGTSDMELALRAVLRKLESRQARIVPRELTNVYYHGRQEDAGEFLVLLLAECPALHPCLRGLEVPLLRCRHCGCERTSQPEEFLSLQISVQEEGPMRSVQEAMTHYLQRTQIRQDFTDWSCENAECIGAQRALDEPLAFYIIPEWPQVLQLLLKRWTLHDVVGHKVHCNDVLDISGNRYRLQALVTHIGRSADAGHYVAYTRHGAGFLRMSDTSVTHVPQDLVGDFVSLPDEKVYLVFYVALPAAAHPDDPVRVPVLDLDGSDSDSDVIVQQDNAVPASSGGKRPGTAGTDTADKKPRVDSYSIASVLHSSNSFPAALKKLREDIPGFTTTDKTADGYMSYHTLRYQHRNPSVTGLWKSWQVESQHYFKPFQQKPRKRTLEPATTEPAIWAQTRSWTFCAKCGRHRPRTQKVPATDSSPCRPACDPCPESLLVEGDVNVKGKLMAYVTPQEKDWDALLAAVATEQLSTALTAEELESLSVVRIYVDYKMIRGGKSEITSLKKQSVVRAEWRDQPLRQVQRSKPANAAFEWLMHNNSTYRSFVDNHEELQNAHASDNNSAWRRLPTAELLLNMPGIEVAVRPWLYPWPSYADTDIKLRLTKLQLIKSSAKPSLRTSWERKTTSRCASYANDFHLQALLYDIAMARTISSVANIAAAKHIAPEAIASDMDMFEVYWQNQVHKMEDVCRLEFERHQSMDKAMPSIFLTVAPAEWTFPLHDGMFFQDSLTKQQCLLTRHMFHVLDALLQEYLLKEGPHLTKLGIAAIRQWSVRCEFQSRGTVHVHCVLWADFVPGVTHEEITGRTGRKHNSALVKLLEDLFHCRVDVQAGMGQHNLMRYIMGYVQKASDALSFKAAESRAEGMPHESTWKTTYRLLCKKAPLEQEMALEFAGLSMVRHSFLGSNYFAPIPGSKAVNLSRAAYNAFQNGIQEGKYGGYCFLSWLRDHRIDPLPNNTCKVVPRSTKAQAKDVGVALQFPFELLDIFIGAWAATFLLGMDERRLLPQQSANYPRGFDTEYMRRNSFDAPEGCHHLKAVLCLDDFQFKPESSDFGPHVSKLISAIEQDLLIRGLTADRIATFKARVNSCALLLQSVYDKKEDAAAWSARRIFQPPQRTWSAEQQEVLTAIAEGTSIADANMIRHSNRLLHVTGGPGTGKTEVIIAAAQRAVDDGCKVLIAGPIGLLVSLYRTRLSPSPNLTMETLHASFKVTRQADEPYVPPGRLRAYDLIVFDEISQIDAHVWRLLQTALSELHPQPFVVFVGDFQQLQPIHGPPQLQLDLERQESKLPKIELRPHAAARSTDPIMLDFLNHVRVAQPSRATLEHFFAARTFSKDPSIAAREARAFEEQHQQAFTFLTVTNRGASDLNLECLRLDFPEAAAALAGGAGYPADAASGQNRILIEVGMRLRLTRNLDKDRGFVNGNLGVVKSKLRPDVFVVKTIQEVLILVHPITVKGFKFIPVCYAYATTIRRAQGATLTAACLCFNRRRPDRGYAYVGASRVKHHSSLFHMGAVRRTDWLPVNGDPENEQLLPGPLSDSSHSSEDFEPEDDSSSEPDPDSSDMDSFEPYPDDSSLSLDSDPSADCTSTASTG